MSSGERLIGAAKGKQSDTEALCQSPPPPKSGLDQATPLLSLSLTVHRQRHLEPPAAAPNRLPTPPTALATARFA